jgi:hypothetical protein
MEGKREGGDGLVGFTVWVNSLMVLRRVRLTITTLEKGRGVLVSSGMDEREGEES